MYFITVLEQNTTKFPIFHSLNRRVYYYLFLRWGANLECDNVYCRAPQPGMVLLSGCF